MLPVHAPGMPTLLQNEQQSAQIQQDTWMTMSQHANLVLYVCYKSATGSWQYRVAVIPVLVLLLTATKVPCPSPAALPADEPMRSSLSLWPPDPLPGRLPLYLPALEMVPLLLLSYVCVLVLVTECCCGCEALTA